MNKEKTWKIYLEQLDESGKVIGRGIYHKDYKKFGNAYRIASELYGDRTDFNYIIAWRNPWKEYRSTIYCDICAKSYERIENHLGAYLKDRRISIVSWDHTVHQPAHMFDDIRLGAVCPDCHAKVLAFVKSLMLEVSDNE